MRVLSGKHADVHVDTRVLTERAQEIYRVIEGVLRLTGQPNALGLGHKKGGSSGNIQRHADKGFIHRNGKRAVAADSFFIAKSLGQRMTESDADVLIGVMNVDFQISAGFELQIKKAVFRKQRKHVVKERDLGIDRGGSLPLDRKLDLDVGFRGLAFDRGLSDFHDSPREKLVPIFIIPPMGRDGAIPTTVHEKKIKVGIEMFKNASVRFIIK